jgi:hypothetical protein
MPHRRILVVPRFEKLVKIIAKEGGRETMTKKLCNYCAWILHGLALTGFTMQSEGEKDRCERCGASEDLALVKVMDQTFNAGIPRNHFLTQDRSRYLEKFSIVWKP